MMNYTGKINDWTKAVHRPVADREIQARGGGAAMTVMTTSYSYTKIVFFDHDWNKI